MGLSINLVRLVRFAVAPHVNRGTEKEPSFFPRPPERDETWFVGESKSVEVVELEKALQSALPAILEEIATPSE